MNNNFISFREREGIFIGEIDDKSNPKVNILTSQNLKELKESLTSLIENKKVKGVCFISKKKNIFIAGADIKEIREITTPQEAEEKSRAGKEVFKLLKEAKFPSLCLINGTCLGGGLELALFCDWRFALDDERIKIGLPEVKLGIIPGFGGCCLLPRWISVKSAIKLISSGRTISPYEAFSLKLVDKILPESQLLDEAVKFLKKHPRKRKYPHSLKNLLFKYFPLSGSLMKYFSYQAIKKKVSFAHYPAPYKATEVAIKSLSLNLDKALKYESEVFSSLAITRTAKNLIRLFFLDEEYKKKKWVKTSSDLKIRKCLVLGAGVMGGTIAFLLSRYGYLVRVKDIGDEPCLSALRKITSLYKKEFKKKKIKKHQLLKNSLAISFTDNYKGLEDVDLIIEAVSEDINIKKKVLEEISQRAKKTSLIASNTSSLSIEEMASFVKEKERFLGLHFFNPANIMPLVEIVPSSYTTEGSVAEAIAFARSLKKTPLLVKDACGFLVNRILIPYLLEAAHLLEEGVDFSYIDKVMCDFGMPLGPFSLMDVVGVDVGYKVAKIFAANFPERMPLPFSFEAIYKKGWLGEKTKEGFYLHNKKKKVPNKSIYKLFPSKKKIPPEEIISRLIYVMVNEAAYCLYEGIVSQRDDIDIGMIYGCGFPPFRGGLIGYARSQGLNKVYLKLKQLSSQTHSRIAVFKDLEKILS